MDLPPQVGVQLNSDCTGPLYR